jgi:hypothetical protein
MDNVIKTPTTTKKESKYYRILTYEIIGRLTAAATLASTLQLSSKPKPRWYFVTFANNIFKKIYNNF